MNVRSSQLMFFVRHGSTVVRIIINFCNISLQIISHTLKNRHESTFLNWITFFFFFKSSYRSIAVFKTQKVIIALPSTTEVSSFFLSSTSCSISFLRSSWFRLQASKASLTNSDTPGLVEISSSSCSKTVLYKFIQKGEKNVTDTYFHSCDWLPFK